MAIHRHLDEHGFAWIHTPMITASDAEGAGEMFRVSTLDLANLPPAGAITGSSIWHFQLWFRDVGPGGAFTNLSDALALEFVG